MLSSAHRIGALWPCTPTGTYACRGVSTSRTPIWTGSMNELPVTTSSSLLAPDVGLTFPTKSWPMSKQLYQNRARRLPACRAELFLGVRMARGIPVGDRVALIDDEDHERLSQRHWRLQAGKRGCFYAVTGRGLLMHREILVADDTQLVDHRNGDGLDNRRANLRVCTNAQNMMNQAKVRGASKFKGVVKRGTGWGAHIKHDGDLIWLGTFDSERSAAEQYDRAARALFGQFARTNAAMGLLQELRPLPSAGLARHGFLAWRDKRDSGLGPTV